eukprot:TRINITY_DN3720_c1_g1_i1.p1 TRINITY_DN3720_c1_g1~~TRINITY_DN3720_c1_g1_i1.p1  ORF type:complete len:840 (+),score=285.14 TRINITY_DN3720_c1_g1_i1:150-2669(+)
MCSLVRDEEVCMAIQRCQRGREAYIECCQRLQIPVLDAIVARFNTPADSRVCKDPDCPVRHMDLSNTDDVAKRNFLETHPYTHICTEPNCARRTDKHWFHLKTHIHMDGMIFLAAHTQYVEPQIHALASALQRHGHLKEIKMNQCGIKDASAVALLNAISQCKTEGVELFKNNFSADGLPSQALAALLNTVRTLKLNGNHLGDAGVGKLAHALSVTPNSPLRELYLNVTFVSDGGIGILKSALQHNMHLSVLGFRENDISAVGAAHLSDVLGGGSTVFCQCWNIPGSVQQNHELHFFCGCGETVRYNTPSTCPAVPIPNQPNLPKTREHTPYSQQEITVCCKSDAHANEPGGYVKLGAVNAGGVAGMARWRCQKCGLDLDPLAVTQSVTRPHPTISELQLRGNPIEDLGAIALSAGLIHNKVLGSLELRRCNLTHVGIKALLEHGKELTALNLNDNSLHDEGAKVLSEHLPNMKLRTLGLQRTGIKLGGIKLCESFKRTPTLTGIDISQNQLGDAFAEHLSAILAATNLESLDVNTCRINQTGAVALAKALQATPPPKITHLDFSNNFSLGMAGGEWANTIEKNASMVRLSLTANSMDHSSMQKILDGLKRNTTLTSVHLYGRSDGGAPDQFANHSLPEARKYLSTRKDKIGTGGGAAAAKGGPTGMPPLPQQQQQQQHQQQQQQPPPAPPGGPHGQQDQRGLIANMYARMGISGQRAIPIGCNGGSPMRYDIQSGSPPPPLSNSPCFGSSPLQSGTPPLFTNSPPNHSSAMRIESREDWEADSPINQRYMYGMLRHLTPDKANDYLGNYTQLGVSYKTSTDSASSMPQLLDSLASSYD